MHLSFRYRQSSKKQKSAIFDEFCATCEYNRKYAIYLIYSFKRFTKPKLKKRGKPSKYKIPAVIDALRNIWLVAHLPCSKHLKSILPQWLGKLEEARLSIDMVRKQDNFQEEDDITDTSLEVADLDVENTGYEHEWPDISRRDSLKDYIRYLSFLEYLKRCFDSMTEVEKSQIKIDSQIPIAVLGYGDDRYPDMSFEGGISGEIALFSLKVTAIIIINKGDKSKVRATLIDLGREDLPILSIKELIELNNSYLEYRSVISYPFSINFKSISFDLSEDIAFLKSSYHKQSQPIIISENKNFLIELAMLIAVREDKPYDADLINSIYSYKRKDILDKSEEGLKIKDQKGGIDLTDKTFNLAIKNDFRGNNKLSLKSNDFNNYNLNSFSGFSFQIVENKKIFGQEIARGD